jgi:predicted GIY-YIG superfamily endonuclease
MNYVYCMTFPNCKKYIGVTNDFKRRIRQHRSAYKNNRGSLVHRAIRKYGENLVNIKILGTFENRSDALNFEQKMISQSDSFGMGYNLTLGGEGQVGSIGRTPWNKNKPLNDQVRSKISKTLGSKPVNVYKTGNFIGCWHNLNKCSRDLNLHRGNITHCLTGKLKTTGGYSFEYRG